MSHLFCRLFFRRADMKAPLAARSSADGEAHTRSTTIGSVVCNPTADGIPGAPPPSTPIFMGDPTPSRPLPERRRAATSTRWLCTSAAAIPRRPTDEQR